MKPGKGIHLRMFRRDFTLSSRWITSIGAKWYQFSR
jgi:hypothetical protein